MTPVSSTEATYHTHDVPPKPHLVSHLIATGGCAHAPVHFAIRQGTAAERPNATTRSDRLFRRSGPPKRSRYRHSGLNRSSLPGRQLDTFTRDWIWFSSFFLKETPNHQGRPWQEC